MSHTHFWFWKHKARFNSVRQSSLGGGLPLSITILSSNPLELFCVLQCQEERLFWHSFCALKDLLGYFPHSFMIL